MLKDISKVQRLWSVLRAILWCWWGNEFVESRFSLIYRWYTSKGKPVTQVLEIKSMLFTYFLTTHLFFRLYSWTFLSHGLLHQFYSCFLFYFFSKASGSSEEVTFTTPSFLPPPSTSITLSLPPSIEVGTGRAPAAWLCAYFSHHTFSIHHSHPKN